jgi:hypothetical protein
VTVFVSAHAEEPASHDVLFTLRHLGVREEFRIGDTAFLPPSLSRASALADLLDEPHVAGIVQVAAVGTNPRRIAERARLTAEHALRLLRNGLQTTPGIPNRQLRFRLGERFAFTDSPTAGWRRFDDAASTLTTDAETAELAVAMPAALLPEHASTRIEAHANLAVQWADRSIHTSDPLTRILFLFFALEALVGDSAAGEKGRRIAFRRAMLDHASSGGFRDPHITYGLYDEVRSAAVHGSQPLAVTEQDANRFDVDVRLALGQLLEYAASSPHTRHSKVIESLDHHPDAAELVQWLRDTAPGASWDDFTP